jgi:hypothetical protein
MPNKAPNNKAQAMANTIAHQRLTTKALTCGVKYKPKAAPITHCPALRSQPELRVGKPDMDASAVTIKGPSIQGMGV